MAIFSRNRTNDKVYNDPWQNSNTMFNGMSNCLQFEIYSDDNTTIRAGIDPFNLGISANITEQQGNTTYNLSGGISPFGYYGSGGITYSTGKHQVGIGVGASSNTLSGGIHYSYDGYGGGYYLTHYGGNNSQLVGGVNVKLDEFSVRLENDFLAGRGEDRWRSNAVQVSWKNLSIGTYIYNNDPKNEKSTITYGKHEHYNQKSERFGLWDNGQTYISPIYVAYNFNGWTERVGSSHPSIQNATQNWFAHERGFARLNWFGHANYFMDYDDFNEGFYYYSGYSNPYSIWGN